MRERDMGVRNQGNQADLGTKSRKHFFSPVKNNLNLAATSQDQLLELAINEEMKTNFENMVLPSF